MQWIVHFFQIHHEVFCSLVNVNFCPCLKVLISTQSGTPLLNIGCKYMKLLYASQIASQIIVVQGEM